MEQQQFHLIGTGKTGTGIDFFNQRHGLLPLEPY
jgi:hypothetical protein